MDDIAKEAFGAVISLQDNVSGVLKKAMGASKSFSGEVDKAKEKLKKLEQEKLKEKELRIKNSSASKAIEEVKKKMEPLTKKVVSVAAKTENAIQKIDGVKKKLDSIKDKTVSVMVNGAKNLGKGLATGALVVAAAGFTAVAATGGLAIGSAIEFEASMKNVGTLLDGDVNAKLKTMSSELKNVSKDTGIASAELSGGLYQSISAFGDSADTVKQLEIAAKAAKAGGATTTDAINLLSAVTKGYGDTSVGALGKVSDLAFQTVKLGQTTFPELAASMGSVVPLASTLKVKQEELFGAMATLTGVTGNTAEVSTQLRSTLEGFMSPTADMTAALEKMGYANGAVALESESLEGILKKLKDSVEGDEIAFANMFGSVEAKNAVLALTGAQAENFSSKIEGMASASGAADKAFKTQTSSVKELFGKIKNSGMIALSSIGEKALPYIATAMEKVIDHLPEIESAMDTVFGKVGPIISTAGAALTGLWQQWQPVLAQIGTKFQDVWTQVQPFFSQIMGNFQSILPSIQPVVATFLGMIATMMPIVMPIVAALSSAFAAAFPVVAAIVTDVGSKIGGVMEFIGSKMGFITDVIAWAGPMIGDILSTMWKVVGPIVDLAVGHFKRLFSVVEWAWPGIQAIIETAWKVIKPIFEGIGGGIELLGSAMDKAGSFVDGVFGGRSESGKVGANALGTQYWRGGWTTVGEHGAELVNLPGGSKVYSNSRSNQLGGSGGPVINIYGMTIREEADIEKVADRIAKKLKDVEDDVA